jgi:hypothetical protein
MPASGIGSAGLDRIADEDRTQDDRIEIVDEFEEFEGDGDGQGVAEGRARGGLSLAYCLQSLELLPLWMAPLWCLIPLGWAILALLLTYFVGCACARRLRRLPLARLAANHSEHLHPIEPTSPTASGDDWRVTRGWSTSRWAQDGLASYHSIDKEMSTGSTCAVGASSP